MQTHSDLKFASYKKRIASSILLSKCDHDVKQNDTLLNDDRFYYYILGKKSNRAIMFLQNQVSEKINQFELKILLNRITIQKRKLIKYIEMMSNRHAIHLIYLF